MALFKKLGYVFLFTIIFFITNKIVWANDPCANLAINDKPGCYEKQIALTQNQSKTLSSQIDLLNNKIYLTKSQISVTQDKLDKLTDSISSVSGKITNLESSLVDVSNILANRITKTYMIGRNDPVLYLLSASTFSDFWQRFEYLRIVQKHDKELVVRMAASKKNYNDQKQLLEDKKKQVEVLSIQLKKQKSQLDIQNNEKKALLEVTRNDESRYQQLLSDARRELEAVRTALFSVKKDVKKGDVIGLMGSTGFSTGPHLHFGVYNLSENQSDSFNYNSGADNPLNYLKSRNLSMDSGACSDKHDGDSFGSGGWEWPLNNPKVSQCYGKTPYSWVYANGFHEGFDMYDNGNVVVTAVEDGVAYFYRGSSSFGNNVRIFHSNGKMTLYLHLQ